MEVAVFTCSICSEVSRDICVYCTKDACANHLCGRCRRCSDCCQCEVALVEMQHELPMHRHLHASNGHATVEEPAKFNSSASDEIEAVTGDPLPEHDE